MKTLRNLLFLIPLLAITAFTADQKETKLENSLLWKIEKEGINTSYLFGTIHLISQEKFYMPDKVKTAFEETEKLMLEIDITDSEQMMSIMQLAVMADGITIKDLISEDDYSVLDSAVLMSIGMGIEMFQNFKPFVIESFLLSKVIDGEPASYEMELAKMAQADSRSILQLETIEKQMTIFDEIPYEEQAKDLMRYAKGDEDMKKQFTDMVDLYLEEDLNGLTKYLESYYTEDIWIRKLLIERNQAWIPIIKNTTHEHPVFIAVGAGHLGGDRGVINLLRKEGFSVTAVFNK